MIKRSGSTSYLSWRDRGLVLLPATQNKMATTGIRNVLNLNCSRRTICSVLHNTSYVKFKKKKRRRKAPLLRRHKIDRLNFAKETMAWTSKWYSELFSEEKKLKSGWSRRFSLFLAFFTKISWCTNEPRNECKLSNYLGWFFWSRENRHCFCALTNEFRKV